LIGERGMMAEEEKILKNSISDAVGKAYNFP